MTYIAYLDEFGHIGPYISRDDPKYNDSPVFGLSGFVIPASAVREFGTWFFQRKCELLDFEIKRSGKYPALWEKKGASLFTVANVEKYPELRRFTNKLFKKIEALDGFIFYVGIKKSSKPGRHDPNRLYAKMLIEAIKRIDTFCIEDCTPAGHFLLALDEHDQRSALITAAAQSMYAQNHRRRALIEPPFHLESHRYQTVQAADWISGLIGRFGAYWKDPESYPEYAIFRHYFEQRLNRIARRSGIRD